MIHAHDLESLEGMHENLQHSGDTFGLGFALEIPLPQKSLGYANWTGLERWVKSRLL